MRHHTPHRTQRRATTKTTKPTKKKRGLLRNVGTLFKIWRGTRAISRDHRDNTFATAQDDVASTTPKKIISMNKFKTLGFLRHLLTLVGGIAVGVGYVDKGTATEITGAVLTVAGFLASHFAPEKQL